MRSEVIDPRADARWAQLLSDDDATLFHSAAWAHVLADTYGFEPRASLVIDDAGQPVAGVPWVEVDDLRSRRIVATPFADVCDPLGATSERWPVLFEALSARQLPVHIRCARCAAASLDDRMQLLSTARWHHLVLADDAEKNLDACSPTMQRGIRKAERSGVEVSLVDDDEYFIDTFMAMHVGLRKDKYRLLAQPRRFLEAMRDRFAPSGGWYPLLATHQGRPLAATLYLRHGDVLTYKFNASYPEALGLRPNNLLLWSGVELGIELGCTELDLGASDDDQPGLIRFKRALGCDESEIVRLRYEPADHDRGAERQRGELLGALTDLFTAPGVPNDVSERAGALLYRNFA